MKFIYKLLIVALVFTVSACNFTELDLLDNPNAVTPDNASVNDLYNNVQLEFRDFYNSMWYTTASTVRMIANTSSYDYQNAFSPTNMNGIWTNAYSNLMVEVDALVALADDRGLDVHAGSAKVMKAYTMMALVDIFARVPYSEALLGSEVLSPKLDEGQAVYAAAVALLDEAANQLGGTSAAKPANNLFNDGSAEAWLKVANTLKLRAALTTRLVDPSGAASTINSLVSDGNIIDDASEDFQFNYGNQRLNPNSRHPFYTNHYESGDGDYMSTYYMWLLRADKQMEDGTEVIDPRIRFYFHRQTNDATAFSKNEYSCHFSDTPDPDSKPAHYNDVDPRIPYCIASSDGYWGRDHLNNEGIPPDGPIRTNYGLYPGGGEFDDNLASEAQQEGTTGALGQGINPIMLSSFVHFMRAEAALTVGTSDDPRAMLQRGIEASLDKVVSFASRTDLSYAIASDPATGEETPAEVLVPSDDDLQEYVDFVMAQYDAATTDDERLDIIGKEYFIALWGNGLEAYNLYRRTGKPDNMAPSLEPGPGSFIRSMFLPAVHVNLNATTSDNKSLTEAVFWDTNPEGFVY